MEDHGFLVDFVHDFADAFTGVGHEEHEALGDSESDTEDEHRDGDDSAEEAVKPEVESNRQER